MKLGLVSTCSTRNLGEAAIYAALAQLAPERRVHCSLSESFPAIVRGLERDRHLDDCDAFVSAGGDGIGNAGTKPMTRRYLRMLAEMYLRRDRTFVFGQSIPASRQGISQRMLSTVLRRLASVVVRDRKSHQILKNRGLDAGLSYDTAFVLRPQTQALEAAYGLLARHGLNPERTALISLCGASAFHDVDRDNCDRELLDIAGKLAERGHQPAFLIQSDGSAPGGERTQAMRLSRTMDNVPIVDPFAVQVPSSPCDVLIALLSLANIVVAIRYHSAVLRLVTGRAPFVLHRSDTGSDLCDRLGLPGQRMSSGIEPGLIEAIEKSADMTFDPDPIARDVTDHFTECIKKVA